MALRILPNFSRAGISTAGAWPKEPLGWLISCHVACYVSPRGSLETPRPYQGPPSPSPMLRPTRLTGAPCAVGCRSSWSPIVNRLQWGGLHHLTTTAVSICAEPQPLILPYPMSKAPSFARYNSFTAVDRTATERERSMMKNAAKPFADTRLAKFLQKRILDLMILILTKF